jgi:hypothetical protein
MGAVCDTFTCAGSIYDRVENSRPEMSVAELRQARQALWNAFQDDPNVMYYLGEFYRRRVDPAAVG